MKVKGHGAKNSNSESSLDKPPGPWIDAPPGPAANVGGLEGARRGRGVGRVATGRLGEPGRGREGGGVSGSVTMGAGVLVWWWDECV